MAISILGSLARWRPRVSSEVRHLIVRMARENFLWGAPRSHGELLMLGFSVSQATVSRLWSAKTERPSGRAGRAAVLMVKSVQDGVRHDAAGPVEAMPLTLHLHGAMLTRNGKAGS